MLCGSFKKKRRQPGDEYRLVRSNNAKIIPVNDNTQESIKTTNKLSSKSSSIKDLIIMVSFL